MLNSVFVHRVLERRIASYPAGEVMFNLLAITSRLASLRSQLSTIENKPEAERTNEEAAELSNLKENVGDIETRLKDWEVENSLRRHNYVGLVHAVLVEMAKQGQLEGRIEEAKTTRKKKIEERKAKGVAVDED